MKARIERPDGTVIRVTGTPEEVADVIARVSPAPSAPFYIPTPFTYPQPWPGYPWTLTTSDSFTVEPVGTVGYPSSTNVACVPSVFSNDHPSVSDFLYGKEPS